MEEETKEGQLRRAYQIGLKLKNSGLQKDIIYARIEKQGIDAEIAMQVAEDVTIERHKSRIKEEKPKFEIAVFSIIIGIVASIAIFIVFPGQILIPVGLILSGFIYALISYNKMK